VLEVEMKVSSLEFANHISQYATAVSAGTEQTIEIWVRGELRATLEKFLPQSTDEAWGSITVSDLQLQFRRLREPVIVRHYNEPVAIYTPLKPFGQIRGGSPLDRYGQIEDPYSWAVMSIRDVLERMMEFSGRMSEGEYEILASVAKTIAEEDPAWANPTMLRLIDEAKALHAKFLSSIR